MYGGRIQHKKEKDYIRKDREHLLHEKLEKYQQRQRSLKKESNGIPVVKKNVMCCRVLGLVDRGWDGGNFEEELGGHKEESIH